jgi:hypothetical protein
MRFELIHAFILVPTLPIVSGVCADGHIAAGTMLAALTLYLEGSYFNNHIAQNRSRSKPRSVMALYRRLGAKTPYPLDDLVPAGHDLGWLHSGQSWGERALR